MHGRCFPFGDPIDECESAESADWIAALYRRGRYGPRPRWNVEEGGGHRVPDGGAVAVSKDAAARSEEDARRRGAEESVGPLHATGAHEQAAGDDRAGEDVRAGVYDGDGAVGGRSVALQAGSGDGPVRIIHRDHQRADARRLEMECGAIQPSRRAGDESRTTARLSQSQLRM